MGVPTATNTNRATPIIARLNRFVFLLSALKTLNVAMSAKGTSFSTFTESSVPPTKPRNVSPTMCGFSISIVELSVSVTRIRHGWSSLTTCSGLADGTCQDEQEQRYSGRIRPGERQWSVSGSLAAIRVVLEFERLFEPGFDLGQVVAT